MERKPEPRITHIFTVKLARSKLPENAGNFTWSLQVKRPHTQFTCVTCSLPVKTVKFTCVEAASTSRRIYANCLQAHAILPEYHGNFTGNFTCRTHATLPATSMQNFLLLQAKIHATYRQKHWNRRQNTRQTQAKMTANAGNNTRTITGKKPAIPHRITCNCRQSAITPQVKSPAKCR